MNGTPQALAWYRSIGVTAVVTDVAISLQEHQPPAAALPPTPHVEPQIATENLEALRSRIKAFDRCALKNTAMNLVFGDGDPAASIMFVGEAPGTEEDIQGIPFVGPSGQLLNKMLAAINLTRAQVYVTNVLPWRPPGNRAPTDQEVSLYTPFIKAHIALIKPKILVLLGGLATKALTGETTGILRLRGKWLEYACTSGARIPALPTFNPLFLLHQPLKKREAWNDFKMLNRLLPDN
ncbi:MAG: uracil-DNA glycosylase [Holosporales bacterium]|jgi:uracil-DNA glycosylase family 4